MKRRLLIALLAVIGSATLWVAKPALFPADRPVTDRPVVGSAEAIKRATAVGGRPVTDAKLPNGQSSKAVAGELLVKLPNDAIASKLGAQSTGIPEIYLLPVSPAADLGTEATRLASIPGVAAVTPNFVVTKTVTPNDSLYNTYQWNMGKIGAPAAWDRTTGSSSIVIASLDTGINHNHEDLAGKIWTNPADIVGNGLDDDGNGYADDFRGMDFVNATQSGGVYYNDANGAIDDEGHGSLTASVFAASTNNGVGIAGLDWQARIMPVKVLDTNGYGSLLDVAAGIRYAAGNGAKVINMSLGAFGLSSDFTTDAAIDYAYARGATLVAASGNDGSPTVVDYPAINPKVISVGASESNDNIAGYSNGGTQLTISAPGTGIAATNALVSQPSVPALTLLSGSSALTTGAYRYSITATNANGETIASVPPSYNPDANRASVGANQQVRLNWSGVFGATGYKIYRTAVDGVEGSQKFMVSVGNVTTYTDAGSVTLTSTPPPTVNGALLNNSYSTASGTSLATPHVAGAAGLILSLQPQMSPAQIRAILTDNADKAPQMGGQNRTNAYGFGRLNIQRALNALPNWSAQYAGQSSHPTLFPGDQAPMYVDFRNTGLQSWSASGPNPVRLGTSRPRDRGPSAFQSNDWVSPTRLATITGKVENGTVIPTNTVAPGEIARFSFTLNGFSLGAAHTFREYYQPVVEGITWMEDYGVFADVTVKPAWMKYSAAYAGQSSYATIGAGDQVDTFVDFRNNGPATWSSDGSNPVRLGTSRGRDRMSRLRSPEWQSATRPGSFSGKVESNGSVTPAATIAPGETARFPVKFTGPPVAGTTNFREYFQPVVEGITWMEDYGVFWDVTVTPKSFQYAYAGQTGPSVLQPGQKGAATLDLTNTGTATWRRNTAFPVNLGTSRPRDRLSPFHDSGSWPTRNRQIFQGKVVAGSLVASDTVAPGETARFSFQLQAPNQGGFYQEYFQPLVENYEWLSDIGIYYSVFVPDPNAPDHDYGYVGQDNPPVLAKDAQGTAKLRLRNLGKQTWASNGANPVRLGTDRAMDRPSGFSVGSNWLSASRIKLTRNLTDAAKNSAGETSIAPGEIAEFEFTVTATPSPGTYREYFTPLAEGVNWMPDRGIYWDFTVQKLIMVGLAQQADAIVTSTAVTTIKNDAGQTFTTVPANIGTQLIYDGTYRALTVNGAFASGSPLRIEQAVGGVATVSNLADNASFNRFRGTLSIKSSGPGTWLVNELDTEDYLKGLGEVPDSWNIEAIKAQVIAARTYAGRKLAAPNNDIFTLYDDTRDQVYNGYNNEAAKPNHVTAINATKGVALYHNGSLIQAFYSSDTGGASESNENVWGGSPIAYLRGVSDPWEKPDVWSKTVANSTLQANFGLPGNVDGIAVTERYPSGRVKTVVFTVSGGGQYGRTYAADTHRSKFTTRSGLITTIGRSGNDWVINGRGFGHGIGMGQWGAYNQANAGRSYQQILQYYYSGSYLGTLY